MLYNGKSLVEDGQFALEVMEYINSQVNEFKEEDGHLYAIYGTPAENLCGLQVKQFRNKYGIIEGVSDREYVSNSFHCHVTEDITPIEKQDKEGRFWNLCNGGKIQYVKYPIDYNLEAVKTLIRRAMDKGYLRRRQPVPCLLRRLRPSGAGNGRLPQVRQQEPDQDRPDERLSFLFQGPWRHQAERRKDGGNRGKEIDVSHALS